MIYCECDVELWGVREKGYEMGFISSDQVKICILFSQ
jgi:hypothetical protein